MKMTLKNVFQTPCHNGATCVDDLDRYECVCVAGFTDVNCQDNINDCLPPPCNNGRYGTEWARTPQNLILK